MTTFAKRKLKYSQNENFNLLHYVEWDRFVTLAGSKSGLRVTLSYLVFSLRANLFDTALRDRPFNLQGQEGVMVFCFFQIFFSDNTKSSNIYLFCRAKCKFFFQNLTLGYILTKTLNQIIFFSSTKIRIFFSVTLGIRIFF